VHGSELGRLTAYRVHASHSESLASTMDATDLEFIPRAVRDKLDRVVTKLHLAQWQALTLEERRELYEMPCTGSEEISTFRVRLDALVWQRCGQRLRRL
jgi:hypothetical protein